MDLFQYPEPCSRLFFFSVVLLFPCLWLKSLCQPLVSFAFMILGVWLFPSASPLINDFCLNMWSSVYLWSSVCLCMFPVPLASFLSFSFRMCFCLFVYLPFLHCFLLISVSLVSLFCLFHSHHFILLTLPISHLVSVHFPVSVFAFSVDLVIFYWGKKTLYSYIGIILILPLKLF